MADDQRGFGLLFGVLGLQNSFLTREQLLAAVDRWLADKSQSLESLIIQASGLSREVAELLRNLTRIHLAKHDQRVEDSIASLSSVDDFAEELRTRGDAELNDSLSHVATPSSANKKRSSKSKDADDSSSSSISTSRFRVLRPHAKGGLGEVFVAEDVELHREVALKEIQERYADSPESRARFVVEAEITGGLEHPGIVPVYGLGQYDNGRPYYAMRFIRGDSLRDAVDAFHRGEVESAIAATIPIKRPRSTVEDADSPASPPQATPIDHLDVTRPNQSQATPADRSVPTSAQVKKFLPSAADYASVQFRQLLGRFTDVCNAIEYAHSRGVLHRDLKPGNIMLGKFGETLVVDWGLAKAKGREGNYAANAERTLVPSSESGSAPTQTGSIIGTPAFMSPEQAAGRMSELGPASDVYSLGATLYYVLTGIAAFKAPSVTEVLLRVQAGKFEPPIHVNHSIPAALNAICLKAMAREPSMRYSSPRAISEDIDRFLADEPVQAFVEPLSLQTRRWLRKHPRSVAGLAATLLVGLVSTAAIIAIVSDANNKLGLKNQALTEANRRESAARQTAVANEALARQQSQLALSTLTSVIEDIQGGLRSVQGGGEIRRRLLLTSLDKLGEVSTSLVNQTTVDRNTMVALLELGDVVIQFGTNDEDEIETQELAEALSSEQQSALTLALTLYSRGFEIAEELSKNSPEDVQAQQDLASAYDRMGTVKTKLGDSTSGLTDYTRALAIYEPLVAQDQDNSELQEALAYALDQIGDLHLQQGMVAEARTDYEKALAIRSRLVESEPENVSRKDYLSISQLNVGTVLKRMGEVAEALELFQACMNTRKEASERAPDDYFLMKRLSDAQRQVGEAQRQLGQIAESMATLQDSLKLRQTIAETDPNDQMAQFNLASAYHIIGELHQQQGNLPDARTAFESSLTVRKQLVASDLSNTTNQSELALNYQVLGDIELQSGNIEAAVSAYRESLALREPLADGDLSDATRQRDLAVAHSKLGELLMQEGNAAEALKSFQACFERTQQLAQLDPSDTRAQRELAIAHDHLGDATLRLNKPSDALKYFEESRSLREGLLALAPEDSMAVRDVSVSLERIGNLFQQTNKTRESIPLYEQSLELRSRLAAADPTNATAQRDLSFAHLSIGMAWLRLGDSRKGIASLEACLAIRKELAAADASDARAQRDIANLLLNIGFTYMRARQLDKAIGPYSECIEIQKRLVEQDPKDLQLRRDLASSYYNLGHAQMELEQFAEAADSGNAGIELLKALIADGDKTAETRQQLQFFEMVTAIATEAALVLGPLEDILKLPIDELPAMLEKRGIELVGRGRFDELAPTAEAIVRSEAATESQIYNAACFFSMTAASIKPDPGETLSEEQTTRRQALIKQGIEALKTALLAGFDDLDLLRNDPDLASLRESEEFKTLLPETPDPNDDQLQE